MLFLSARSPASVQSAKPCLLRLLCFPQWPFRTELPIAVIAALFTLGDERAEAVGPTVQFSAGTSSTNAGTSTSTTVPITISSTPSGTFASSFNHPSGLAVDSSGNLYVSNASANTVSKITPSGTVTTFIPVTTNFTTPQGLVFDSSGNLYVACSGSNRVFKFGPTGTLISNNFVTSGLSSPQGLCFDSSGNLYISNATTKLVNTVTSSGGTPTTYASGFPAAPTGIVMNSFGYMYVANKTTGANAVISLVAPGGTVSNLGATGLTDPAFLAFDAVGNLYVSNDTATGTITQLQVTVFGTLLNQTTFFTGLTSPAGLATDSNGDLFIANNSGSTTGSVTVVNGVKVPYIITGGTAISGTDYSSVSVSPLLIPFYITSTALGVNLLQDPGPAKTMTFTLGTPALTTTNLTAPVLGSPSANTLTITEPFMVVQEPAGTSLVSGSSQINFGSNVPVGTSAPLTFTLQNKGPTALSISSITFSGTNPNDFSVTTAPPSSVGANSSTTFVVSFTPTDSLARSATMTINSNDPAVPAFTINLMGSGATAVQFSAASESVNATAGNFSVQAKLLGTPIGQLGTGGAVRPQGVVLDSSGNLYVADNALDIIYKITSQGTSTTFATITGGAPVGMAIDSSQNLYVAVGTKVVKITPAGTQSTFYSSISNIQGLAFDSSGNLFASIPSLFGIWKITPQGSGSTFFSPSQTDPGAMAFDAAGNLYFADFNGNAIIKVNAAGTSSSTFVSGVQRPDYLCFDSFGNLYVTTELGSLLEFSPQATLTTITTGLLQPQGIAMDGVGDFYIGDLSANYVYSTHFTVPFNLGGTALPVYDYGGVTASPLTFTISQTTATISGNVFIDPGNSKTLSFTLGAPSTAAAILGSPSVNTLTIVQPAISVEQPSGNFLTTGTSVVNFGTVGIGVGAPLTFTIHNHGTTNLNVSSVTMSGGNASDFVVTTPPASSVAGGLHTDFVVTFTPQAFGPRSTTLTVATNDPIYPSFTVGLQGSGVCVVQFTTAAQSVNATDQGFSITATLSGNPPTTVTPISTGLGSAMGMAFEGSFLYVTNPSNNTISQVNAFSGGGVTTLVPGTAGLNSPQGITDDQNVGALFVANAGNNTISKVTFQGVVTTFLSTGLSSPQGVIWDSVSTLYIANAGNGTVSSIYDQGTTPTVYASGFNQPTGLAYDRISGKLYVANSGDGTISVVPAGGGTPSVLATGFVRPVGLELDGSGYIYVADAGAGTVSRVPLDGGTTLVIASGFAQPSYLANFYLADSSSGTVTQLGLTLQATLTQTGTAVDGTDYEFFFDTNFFFPAGATSATITGVPLLDAGPPKTITVTLTGGFNPSGSAEVGAIAQETITIVEPTIVVQQPAGTTLTTGVNTINFGNSAVSSVQGAAPTQQTFTVENVGLNNFSINSVTTSGTNAGDFTVTTAPASTINANGSTTFVVTFAPSATGLRSATLTIASSDPIYPSYTVNLIGTGASAAVAFNSTGSSVNASTGAFSIPVTVSGTPTSVLHTFAAGFSTPEGLAFDSSNNLYVADPGATTVYKVTPAGVVSPLATGISSNSLVCDPGGNVYVSSGFSTVNKVTPSGQTSTYVTGLFAAEGLVLDSSGNLYVADGVSNGIAKVPPGGGSFTTYATGLDDPTSLAMDSAGNQYSSGFSDVYKVPAGGGTATVFVPSVFGGFQGLAFDGAGNLFVANFPNNLVDQVSSTGSLTTYISSGLSGPFGVAFDSLNNMYISNYHAGTISQLGRTLVIPYTLSGTAVSGTDYSGISSGVLVLQQGQSTGTLSGTLLSNPGANKTLVVTLGAPSGLLAGLGVNSTYTLTINQGASSPYSTWLTSQGINGGSNTGPTQSYVNDGVANLLKFAFGVFATVNSPAQLKLNGSSIASTGVPTARLVPSGGNTVLAVTYLQSTDASQDLSYTVQFSNDLKSWTNATQSPTVVASGVGFQAMQVLDTAPTHQFARVMVQYSGQ